MNYKEFNDYELLDQIHSCNEEANEILIYKYKPLIINVATKMIKYCTGGVTIDDLIGEGMVALNDAINTFDQDKEANFSTYAKLCIERKIISLVNSTRRYKNKFLNESVSLDETFEEGTIDKFLVDNSSNPLDMVTDYEWQTETLSKLDKELTDLERHVFELKKNDFTYKEIAEILEKDPKAIDNCLQRIKTKLKIIIKNEK